MIELTDVYKVYRNRGLFKKTETTAAIEGLNLSVGGGAFGLLGLNGAGKTTTLKMIATLLYPTGGKITIGGFDTRKNEKKLRRRINMITGSDRMLYLRLTGRENLLYFASLYGLGYRESERRSSELLGLTGLEHAAHKRVEEYSRGMKQRLSIARGLINDPTVLLLDEPTLGLDVSIAAEIRSFIKDVLLSDPKRTIILTSHYMAEIEKLCSRIGILQSGRLIYDGDFPGLYELMNMEEVHRFSIPGECGHRRADIDRLTGGKAAWSDDPDGRSSFILPSSEGFSFLKRMDDLGISGLAFSQEKPGLEDAVLKLTAGGR